MHEEILLDISTAQLWELLSNTNRINKGLNLPALSVTEISPEDYSQVVSTRFWGLPIVWRERPFEWIEGQYYTLTREFEKGPLVWFKGKFAIRSQGQKTLLAISADFKARNIVAVPFAHYFISKSTKELIALIKQFKESRENKLKNLFISKRLKMENDLTLLGYRFKNLSTEVEPGIGRNLLTLLEEGDDEEVIRIRPFELADRWDANREETLKAFLHGVKAGLFDMSWEVLCPNCLAPKLTASNLLELKERVHCATCQIEFGPDLASSVELRFSINPAIRFTKNALYCAGSPSHTPFAIAQIEIEPNSKKTIEVDLGHESYIVRFLKSRSQWMLHPSKSAEKTIECSAENLNSQALFHPGRVQITFSNDREDIGLVRLEKESWKEQGAKASFVTSLQEFRDLFSSQVLSSGVNVAIHTIAILFSDLKDSTALYENIGDANAYAIVQNHFSYLSKIIKRHEGAIVKTIGDAVMAIFYSASNALEAAIEIQKRIEEFRSQTHLKSFTIKLGIHEGPSIAVNANNLLDYFGTTVNIAARIQNESQGSDIVISETVYCDAGVKNTLKKHSLREEKLALSLKGLKHNFQAWRITPL